MQQRMLWVVFAVFLLVLWLVIAFWALQDAGAKKKPDMPAFDGFKHGFPDGGGEP